MITLDNNQIQEFDEVWQKVERQMGYDGGFSMVDMVQAVEDISFRRQNRVCSGLLYSAPTAPSTQGSGAVAPVVRHNVSAGIFVLGGQTYSIDAADILSGVGTSVIFGAANNPPYYKPPILQVGQSVIFSVVVGVWDAEWGGAPITTGVAGLPATTGQALPPSDSIILPSLIEAGVGGSGYLRVGRVTVNRTGNTTVTQTQDNTWRDV